MESYAFTFVDTAIVVSCSAMAIVFLSLPLPQSKGLYKYQLSLRFLAGAYLIMALIKTALMIFNEPVVDMISIEVTTVASLQATLYAFTLITLINPRIITQSYVCKHLIPTFAFVVLYIVVAHGWGNPRILTFAELESQAFHPAIMIREIFIVYYGFQLVYLTRVFCKQARVYENEIDNYFADNSTIQLSWIRYSFFMALAIGILALLSAFIVSSFFVLVFNIAYALFYIGFALFYIRYPSIFIFIEPAILPQNSTSDKLDKSNKRLIWDDLKSKIIVGKYYLQTGITIDEMAKYLKIGRTTLSSFINNEEGMNFNMWINSLRVEEAKSLLINYPEYSLIQISELVGYSEPSNFSRQFKLITNESPSVWRQACQS